MPGPQSKTAAAAKPTPKADATRDPAPLTLRQDWWMTMVREWPDKDVIIYFEDAEQRRIEHEKVVIDYEHERQASESYLEDLDTKAGLASEHYATLEEEGYAEVAEGYAEAVTPLHVQQAFTLAKYRGYQLLADLGASAAILMQKIVIAHVTRTQAVTEVTHTEVTSTGPLPAIEPPSAEETARWQAWTTDPEGQPPPDTLTDLIPGMTRKAVTAPQEPITEEILREPDGQ